MKAANLGFGLVLMALATMPAAVLAASAAEEYARGEALLARGEFDQALDAFASAARADRDNQQYLQQYAMVRRVIQLRQQLASEQDPQRWEYTARALHSFYVTRGLLEEAAALDRQIHARLNNASSATMLAETELALGRNSEAAEVLQKLPPGQSTPATDVLLGIALARQGKMQEARQLAEKAALPDDAGPRTIYAFARLYAATGDSHAAFQTLKRVLETTPPTIQVGYRDHAAQCPDFQSLAATDQWQQVLKTPSKIPESQCSGGAGCAGCPMRGQCAAKQP